jgi:hypothetical protein
VGASVKSQPLPVRSKVPDPPPQIEYSVAPNSVIVKWMAPSDNGSPILAYNLGIHCVDENTIVTDKIEARGELTMYHEVFNLRPKCSYIFMVSASNSVGTGETAKSPIVKPSLRM